MKVKTRLLSLLFCFLVNFSPLYADIRVGTAFFDPPFVISINEGFDIELIRSICQRMRETCQLIPMNFNELFSALNAGKIDIAIDSISISQERLTHYIFSLPYMISKGQFLILKDSNIKTITDLKGKKIGVIRGEQNGSAFYNYLQQNYDSQFQIGQYNNQEDLITALINGAISAAYLDQPISNYWILNGENQFQLLGNAVPIGDGMGIMALPIHAALIQRIDQALQKMEKDNSYLNLYTIYFTHQ